MSVAFVGFRIPLGPDPIRSPRSRIYMNLLPNCESGSMIPVDLSANCEVWIYDLNGSGIQILGIRSRDPFSGFMDMSGVGLPESKKNSGSGILMDSGSWVGIVSKDPVDPGPCPHSFAGSCGSWFLFIKIAAGFWGFWILLREN